MEEEMTDIGSMISRQRQFFYLGHTREVSFRLHQLRMLQCAVSEKEKMILDALYADLRKSPYEGYLTELGIVREEIRFFMKHLPKWAGPRRVRPFALGRRSRRRQRKPKRTSACPFADKA